MNTIDLTSPCVPKRFQELIPGDTFTATEVQYGGRTYFNVSLIKLSEGECSTGNAVATFGELAGKIVQLFPDAETQLNGSAWRSRNSLIDEWWRDICFQRKQV